MRIAIHSQPQHCKDHPLPHQGMWFVFMLMFLMMLLTTMVAGHAPLLG
jgi:hypothetical protein